MAEAAAAARVAAVMAEAATAVATADMAALVVETGHNVHHSPASSAARQL